MGGGGEGHRFPGRGEPGLCVEGKGTVGQGKGGGGKGREEGKLQPCERKERKECMEKC